MAPDSFDDRLQSVAATIRDYEPGQALPLDADQPILLGELNVLLRRFYFSRARVKEALGRFLDELFAGHTLREILPHVAFLRIQRRGESQAAMLALADEVLRERHGASMAECGTAAIPSTYVYLDDAVYTGNRLRYDLTDSRAGDTPAWIARSAPPGCRLLIYVLGCHVAGWSYAARYIRREAARRRISWDWRAELLIDNRRVRGGKAHCLWPEPQTGSPHVEAVVRQLCAEARNSATPRALFRPLGTPPEETLFSSLRNRGVVERALLRAGARLSLTQARHPHHRPLGYEVIPSLGFGTMFVTYRNIANNCPLALWWGHSFGWRPLFPRTVNADG